MIWLSVDLRFNWFGCQLIWDSNDLVVNRSEIQVIWLSIDLRFKWIGCQLIWDSSDLDVKWFEVQVIWLSTDVWFKWFCQTKHLCETSFKNEALKLKNEAFVRDFLQNWSCEAQKRETSFKIEALKLKNEAFLRDFLQNWSFEAQKRSFSARLPSKMKLWSSKMKLFCETSFKNVALQLKNEAFLRDFLQNASFRDEKRSFSAGLPSKTKVWKSKNEAFLRDFLQNWHVEQTLDLRITIRFNDFQVHASKVLRLPRKSWAEAYEVL